MRFCVLLPFLAVGLAAQETAAPVPLPVPPQSLTLPQVKLVYVLPMTLGFDQFLSNQFTRMGVFQITTDSKLADAILTDRLGPAFEEKLEELTKPAVQPAPPEKDADKDESDEPAGKDIRIENAGHSKSTGRSKGNLFLVDPRSRAVIWSTFILPKSMLPQDLDKAATDVAKRVRDTLKQ